MNMLIWGIVALAALIAELLTRVRIALSLCIAAALCVPIALLADHLAVEIVAFAVFSLIFLVLRLLLLRPKRMKADRGVDVEKIVGSRCRVTEKIENLAGSGQARCHGFDWAARALDDEEVFSVGDTVTVVAVEGVRLVCKRA